MQDEEKPVPPIEILPAQLSADALAGVVDNFILREGTDYGSQEVSLEKKREQILKQLDRQTLKILFDPSTESITLMTLLDWKKSQSN